MKTTCGIANDDDVGIITTPKFRWSHSSHVGIHTNQYQHISVCTELRKLCLVCYTYAPFTLPWMCSANAARTEQFWHSCSFLFVREDIPTCSKSSTPIRIWFMKFLIVRRVDTNVFCSLKHSYRIRSSFGMFSLRMTLPWKTSEQYAIDNVLAIAQLHSTWWRHQMETFPRYWPFVRGIHRSPVNSPHKGQWRGVLMFSLICVWIHDWVNNREVGDLRRYRTHYDVTVMKRVKLLPLWMY